jgi:hypothetical protein
VHKCCCAQISIEGDSSSEESGYESIVEETPFTHSSVGSIEEGPWGSAMVQEDFILDGEAEQYAKGKCVWDREASPGVDLAEHAPSPPSPVHPPGAFPYVRVPPYSLGSQRCKSASPDSQSISPKSSDSY